MKKTTLIHFDRMIITYRIIDSLILFISWTVAYILRFHILKGSRFVDIDILFLGIPVWFITQLLYTHNNLYTSQRYFPWHREIFAVFKSHFQAVAVLVVLLYFFNPGRLSRVMLAIYSLMVVVLSLGTRLVVKAILIRLRRRGHNLRRVIFLGANDSIREYARQIINTPELGLSVAGWVHSSGVAATMGIPELSDIGEIPLENLSTAPDAVILGYQSHMVKQQNEAVIFFNKTNFPVWDLPDIEHIFIGYTIESFHGIPMVRINGSNMTVLQKMLKRGTDLLGSIFIIMILSPLMLLISLLVKVTSRGPVFYGQERVSLDGQTFKMWKFRSMRIDAENKSGAVWAVKDDSRTTPIGSLLRKTSLDELPQLWNVLKGEMSLVGPRPERPVFIDQFKEDIPSYQLRHRMKTGITGWAQVNGWRGDTSLEKRIEYDLYYIQSWTFGLDVKILFLTILRGFVNPNAY